MSNPTEGEWLLSGTTIYALEPCGKNFRNRFSATVQGFPTTPKEEVEANARLMRAAPDLRDVCRHLLFVLESMPEPELGGWDWPVLAEMTQAALEKADGKGAANG